MDKTITIDGKSVKFRATARTPRLYRGIIGRDMIRDMDQLRKAYAKVAEAKTEKEKTKNMLTALDLEIFENCAYVMARHANPDIEELTADDWLDTFNMFSIYQILPELLSLWAMNEATTSTAKKK